MNYPRLSPRVEPAWCLNCTLVSASPSSPGVDRCFPTLSPLFMLVFSAPALSEPQSKEPRPSAATMRRASGSAGRPRTASRAPRTPVRGAQTAARDRKGRCASRATPERERRSAATFLWIFSIVRWRRGVGRQSPTKRGRIVRSNKDKLPIVIFANGTNQAYPSCTLLL